MKNIAIFGGSQEDTYKKIGRKNGCNVMFHNGKVRNGSSKKDFSVIIRKSDCVCVMLEAIGHTSAEAIRDVCKQYGVKCLFHNSRGASGAIRMCLENLNNPAAA